MLSMFTEISSSLKIGLGPKCLDRQASAPCRTTGLVALCDSVMHMATGFCVGWSEPAHTARGWRQPDRACHLQGEAGLDSHSLLGCTSALCTCATGLLIATDSAQRLQYLNGAAPGQRPPLQRDASRPQAPYVHNQLVCIIHKACTVSCQKS